MYTYVCIYTYTYIYIYICISIFIYSLHNEYTIVLFILIGLREGVAADGIHLRILYCVTLYDITI